MRIDGDTDTAGFGRVETEKGLSSNLANMRIDRDTDTAGFGSVLKQKRDYLP